MHNRGVVRAGKRLFVLFLLLMCPVFISLNFSSGFRFDADPFNYLGAPSVPVSFLLLLAVYVWVGIKATMELRACILVVSSLFYLILNLQYGSGLRAVFVFFGMLVPVLNFYCLKSYFLRRGYDGLLFVRFYYALSFLVLIKFSVDVLVYSEFCSKYFIFPWVAIYNYYDYFPFVYLCGMLLSLRLFFTGRRILPVAVFWVSLLCLFYTHSRLWLGLGVFLVPLYVLVKLSRLTIGVVFVSGLMFVVMLTFLAGMLDFSVAESSATERFSHWRSFFSSFTPVDFLLPFLNEYRVDTPSGSFHNELLEIFSYFGPVLIVYLMVIKDIFTQVKPEYRCVTTTLVFCLLMGGLVQLNMTNPYVGIVWSTLLACVVMNSRRTV